MQCRYVVKSVTLCALCAQIIGQLDVRYWFSGMALQVLVMKSSEAIRTRHLNSILIGVLALAVAATGFGGWAVAQDKEKISKFLLLKLSRDQSQVLCTAEVFTSCMGFSEQVCFEVSEKALEQCIVPLPDTIFLQDLSNDVLEACPQKVYADAGYSEEKAAACLQKAFDN